LSSIFTKIIPNFTKKREKNLPVRKPFLVAVSVWAIYKKRENVFAVCKPFGSFLILSVFFPPDRLEAFFRAIPPSALKDGVTAVVWLAPCFDA